MAIFPVTVATQLELLTPKNNTMVILDANAGVGDTSITVDDASALPDSGYLTFVDTDEVIQYEAKSSNTLTGVTRGADGTAAAAHVAGVDLEMRWNAAYHTVVADELIAVEQNLSDRIGLHATQLRAPSGSTGAPTYSFAANTDCGIALLDGSTTLTFVVNGNREFASTGSQTFVRLPLLCQSTGTAVDPAFAFDGISGGNSGMYLIGDENLGLSAGATKIVDMKPTGVGIGGTPHDKAILALTSTTLGFLPPRMTTTQRDAITSPPEGLIIANTTTNKHNYYNGSAWKVHVTSGDIVNADVASGAAIAVNKLAALTANRVVVTDASGFLTVVAGVTDTEVGYLDGVTSAIQTQLDAKKTIATGNNYKFVTTGATGLIQETTVTASRAVVTDANGLPSASAVTATELGYVAGVTSAIQTQLDSKLGGTNQPVNILYNGGMEIYQNRTTTATNFVTGDYLIDGYKVLKASNRQIDGGIETGAGNFSEGAASLKVVGGAGNTTADYIYQPVEDWARYKGLTVTLSLSVKTATASAAKAFIDDGVSTIAVSSYHTGGGAFEVLTVTLAISASATRLYIGLQVTAASTIYIDAAMAVIGSTACSFRPEDPATDLIRCQRYYEKSYAILVAPGTNTTSNPVMSIAYGGTGQSFSCFVPFKVTKRTNPTVTLYATDGTSGSAEWGDTLGAGYTKRTSISVTSGGVTPIHGMQFSQAVNDTSKGVSCHYVADARL